MCAVRRVELAYNNVYVVEAQDARVLVDTGPDYRGAFEFLRAKVGQRVPSVVVATHGHVDHAGLGAQWQRRTRNGGSPASAFTFSDGQLHMPTADFELDAAAAATSVGPVNFIGQDLRCSRRP